MQLPGIWIQVTIWWFFFPNFVFSSKFGIFPQVNRENVTEYFLFIFISGNCAKSGALRKRWNITINLVFYGNNRGNSLRWRNTEYTILEDNVLPGHHKMQVFHNRTCKWMPIMLGKLDLWVSPIWQDGNAPSMMVSRNRTPLQVATSLVQKIMMRHEMKMEWNANKRTTLRAWQGNNMGMSSEFICKNIMGMSS